MKRTLHFYIFHEIWPILLVSLSVLVFIILATKMLSITEWIVNKGVHPFDILKVIVYLLPDIIFFALPAAVLMAVIAGFLRLSTDNEIVALHSSGISLYQIMPPVVILAFSASLIAVFTTIYLGPSGNRAFRNSVFRIAQTNAELGIRERIFCEPFDNVTFYIHSFSPRDRIMRDIFIVDRRDPSVTHTIIAQDGRMVSIPSARSIVIELRHGRVLMMDKHLQPASVKFETYSLNIDMKDIMDPGKTRKKGPKEMGMEDLLRELDHHEKGSGMYNDLLMELLEKIAIPLAVFFMGIIGAPLGAQLKSRGRTMGIVVGLMVFLIYYICLAGVRSICETGALSPQLGVWLPDLLLAILIYFLFRTVVKEGSPERLMRFKACWKRRFVSRAAKDR